MDGIALCDLAVVGVGGSIASVFVKLLFFPPPAPAADDAVMTTTELPYSPEVLALWNEKDEEASEKWRQEKIKDFEASGPTKDKRETRVETKPEWPGC